MPPLTRTNCYANIINPAFRLWTEVLEINLMGSLVPSSLKWLMWSVQGTNKFSAVAEHQFHSYLWCYLLNRNQKHNFHSYWHNSTSWWQQSAPVHSGSLLCPRSLQEWVMNQFKRVKFRVQIRVTLDEGEFLLVMQPFFLPFGVFKVVKFSL